MEKSIMKRDRVLDTKDTICIKTENFKVQILARIVRVINEFAQRGFDTREKFLNIVNEMRPYKYTGYKDVRMLQDFYIVRRKDVRLLEDLEQVIEELKAE